MKTLTIAFLLALFAQTSAFAFPPTATTSPGYDRALAESRKARGAGQPDFVLPAPRDVKPRHEKRRRGRH